MKTAIKTVAAPISIIDYVNFWPPPLGENCIIGLYKNYVSVSCDGICFCLILSLSNEKSVLGFRFILLTDA